MPITSDIVTRANARMRTAFDARRVLQGSPTLAINRITLTGADYSKGVEGTEVDTGVAGVPCTWIDLTFEEREQLGVARNAAARRFAFYQSDIPSFTLAMSDRITYAGEIYDIDAIQVFASSGRHEVSASLRTRG